MVGWDRRLSSEHLTAASSLSFHCRFTCSIVNLHLSAIVSHARLRLLARVQDYLSGWCAARRRFTASWKGEAPSGRRVRASSASCTSRHPAMVATAVKIFRFLCVSRRAHLGCVLFSGAV